MSNITTKSNNNMQELEKFFSAEIKAGITKQSNKVIEGTDLAFIAMVMQEGSVIKNIPKTDYMQKPVQESVNDIYRTAFNTTGNSFNADTIANQIGILASNTIKQDIASQGKGTYIPVKPATAKRKRGITERLINTGRLSRSISHQVSFAK